MFTEPLKVNNKNRFPVHLPFTVRKWYLKRENKENMFDDSLAQFRRKRVKYNQMQKSSCPLCDILISEQLYYHDRLKKFHQCHSEIFSFSRYIRKTSPTFLPVVNLVETDSMKRESIPNTDMTIFNSWNMPLNAPRKPFKNMDLSDGFLFSEGSSADKGEIQFSELKGITMREDSYLILQFSNNFLRTLFNQLDLFLVMDILNGMIAGNCKQKQMQLTSSNANGKNYFTLLLYLSTKNDIRRICNIVMYDNHKFTQTVSKFIYNCSKRCITADLLTSFISQFCWKMKSNEDNKVLQLKEKIHICENNVKLQPSITKRLDLCKLGDLMMDELRSFESEMRVVPYRTPIAYTIDNSWLYLEEHVRKSIVSFDRILRKLAFLINKWCQQASFDGKQGDNEEQTSQEQKNWHKVSKEGWKDLVHVDESIWKYVAEDMLSFNESEIVGFEIDMLALNSESLAGVSSLSPEYGNCGWGNGCLSEQKDCKKSSEGQFCEYNLWYSPFFKTNYEELLYSSKIDAEVNFKPYGLWDSPCISDSIFEQYKLDPRVIDKVKSELQDLVYDIWESPNIIDCLNQMTTGKTQPCFFASSDDIAGYEKNCIPSDTICERKFSYFSDDSSLHDELPPVSMESELSSGDYSFNSFQRSPEMSQNFSYFSLENSRNSDFISGQTYFANASQKSSSMDISDKSSVNLERDGEMRDNFSYFSDQLDAPSCEENFGSTYSLFGEDCKSNLLPNLSEDRFSGSNSNQFPPKSQNFWRTEDTYENGWNNTSAVYKLRYNINHNIWSAKTEEHSNVANQYSLFPESMTNNNFNVGNLYNYLQKIKVQNNIQDHEPNLDEEVENLTLPYSSCQMEKYHFKPIEPAISVKVDKPPIYVRSKSGTLYNQGYKMMIFSHPLDTLCGEGVFKPKFKVLKLDKYTQTDFVFLNNVVNKNSLDKEFFGFSNWSGEKGYIEERFVDVQEDSNFKNSSVNIITV